jgi:2,3-dihydroxy-2,3-dihydrophenylpropionate dehydrogenase
MNLLEGKRTLITGGGSGIGLGVVDAFIREGARAAVLDISEEKAEALRERHGDEVVVVVGDATRIEDAERAVAAATAAFGGLDGLVVCQGVWDYFTSIVDLPAERLGEAFDELFAVNVKSVLLSVKAAVPALLESEGSIVLTVSNAGFYTAGGGPLYTASKFAVRGLVSQLAYELSPKVRVNGVAPGGTPTPLAGLKALEQDGMRLADIPDVDALIRSTNPLQIVPEPGDHAGPYVMLTAPDYSRAVTGTVVHSDGGLGVRGLTQVSGLAETTPA